MSPIRLSDFDASTSNADSFIAYVSICRLIGDIAQAQRRNLALEGYQEQSEVALRSWVRELPPAFRLFHQHRVAPYNFQARQMFVPYLISIILLQRPFSTEQAPVSSASLLASSLVAGIFEDFASRDQLRYLGPAFTFYALAAGLMQLIGCRYEALRPASEDCHRVVRISLQQMGQRYGSAHSALRALTKARDYIMTQPIIEKTPEPPSPSTWELLECFGQDLCNQWSLLGQSGEQSEYVANELASVGQDDAMAHVQALDEVHEGARPSGVSLAQQSLGSEPFQYPNMNDPWLLLDSETAPVGSWLFDDYDINIT